MTNQTKSRPIPGLLLLAFTFFFAFAPTCGALGQLLHRVSVWLIGQTGSTLLALTTLTIGVLLIVPVSAWVRFVRWGFRFTASSNRSTKPADRFTSVPAKVIPIRERPEVKDARGGLKYLGYSVGEIDSAMERIDQRGTADEMIRASLKLLRKAV